MPLYLCSAGHLVRADDTSVALDSLCTKCKANARRNSNAHSRRRMARLAKQRARAEKGGAS